MNKANLESNAHETPNEDGTNGDIITENNFNDNEKTTRDFKTVGGRKWERGGEKVAAKINDDNKRRKLFVMFALIGIVIGAVVAWIIIAGGDDDKIVCDRIDDVTLSTI